MDTYGVALSFASEIDELGGRLQLHGRAPNGVDIAAVGSPRGERVTATWDNGVGRGSIGARIGARGDVIVAQCAYVGGVPPFLLRR